MNLRVFYLTRRRLSDGYQSNLKKTRFRLTSEHRPAFNRTLPHSQLRLAPDANASQPRYEHVSIQMRTRLDPDALAYRPRCDKKHKP